MKDLSIIYENKDLIVVDKPAGLVVTPGPGHPFEKTLAGWLREYVGESLVEVGQENRWGIVHRLDKDTSGVMVVTKTVAGYKMVRRQFRDREVFKVYWVLVWGIPEEEKFVIDAPIGRNPRNRMRFVVIESGKRAVTKCRLIEKNVLLQGIGDQFSLLACQLITGRTHQIRVHLKALGHPIVGDPFYSGRRKYREVRKRLERPFLHARLLGLEVSEKEGWCRFESPLPEELKGLIT